MTGTTNDAYPNYDISDPYATADRGSYFRGTSVIQLPPHSEDSSTDSMIFALQSAVSFWVRPVSTDGTLFSKQDDSSFTPILQVDIASLIPRMTLRMYDQSTYTTETTTCPHSLSTS